MPRSLLRVRFAVVTAAVLGLLVSGVAIGAAGSAMIIGSEANNAGTANTSLATNSTVVAFRLLQNGAGGTALMGYVTPVTGPARGVYGRVDSPSGVGVVARNAATTTGSGSAIQAFGVNNVGIVATSDETTAIHGTAGCSGFLCGASGIVGDGAGIFGSGVVGNGAFFGAGVYGTGGLEGVFGTNTSTGGSGVYGSGVNGPGVTGVSNGAGTIDYDCSGPSACWDYPGASFAGYIGAIGQTDGNLGPQGYSRGLLGIANGSGIWGVYSQGDSHVEGSLSISGTCSGCVLSVITKNGSNQAIAQGDAVTLLGVTTADDGSVVTVVGPAKHGDVVFGIADQAMSLTAAKVTTKETSIRVQGIKTKTITVKSPSFTVTAKDRKWVAKGTSAKANAYLRVITSGMLAYQATGAGLTAGDALAVGATTGKLTKADKAAARGTVAGKFGGKLSDGRVVIFVFPN